MKTLSAAVIGLALAEPASAQEAERERGLIVTLGPGIQATPKFPGADDLHIGPWPVIGVRRAGRPLDLEAPDEGFGFGLLGSDSAFDIGPAVNLQRRRREEDVGAAVGDVGWTVEAGGFAQMMLGENFRVRGELRQGIGGHDGLVGDLGADLFARGRGDTLFSIGPRIRWADNDYMDAYYGVTPAVAASTGLAAFDPSSGIHAVGGAAGAQIDLGGAFGLHAYLRYDRLMNEAADSPIVASFGSRDQWSGGVGLSYSFRIGGRR